MARYRAFVDALCGGRALWRTQIHAKIHAMASILVVVMGVICGLEKWEWVSLLIVIGMVGVAEALNTAIEFVSDELTLDWRERIQHAKDIAAFAVLMAAIIAMAVGALIFLPRVGVFWAKWCS